MFHLSVWEDMLLKALPYTSPGIAPSVHVEIAINGGEKLGYVAITPDAALALAEALVRAAETANASSLPLARAT